MRVALFSTCLADGMFPQVGKATVHLLERLGYDVDVPWRQTCCGQMHTNTGYAGLRRDAAEVAAKTYELSEFLVDVHGDTSVGAYYPHRVCTAGDSSCLMHIGGGLSRGGTRVRTVHLAEILAAT